MVGGPEQQHECETQLAEALDLFQRADMKSLVPLILLERAGLAHLGRPIDPVAPAPVRHEEELFA